MRLKELMSAGEVAEIAKKVLLISKKNAPYCLRSSCTLLNVIATPAAGVRLYWTLPWSSGMRRLGQVLLQMGLRGARWTKTSIVLCNLSGNGS